jgi:2-succinyl-5-enolpyruvyl-6-hydroxy-3-cyclohexene-1-carboxylate synthase
LIDNFCGNYDSAVICEHGSGYKGKYETSLSLIGSQEFYQSKVKQAALVIHFGEIAGDCDYASSISTNQVWRVSEDGEMRDPFRRLRYVFDMSVSAFFSHYMKDEMLELHHLYDVIEGERNHFMNMLNQLDLPFSNIWLASKTSYKLPEGSVLHLGILNSFRSWNFFPIPKSVNAYCNSGGYGIDGGPSTLIGASLCHPEKLYFGVFGDLAFFYDMNSLGNHNIGKNLRILLVNNGKGTEFRNYYHPWARFGVNADQFGSAAGHFGNKSQNLVKHYAEDLGFEYLSATTKEEYIERVEHWLNPKIGDRPIVFEVFTNSEDESDALMQVRRLEVDSKLKLKSEMMNKARSILGGEKTKALKSLLKH